MNISNFLITPGVSFEPASNATMQRNLLNGSLTCTFGDYARVRETTNLVQGDYIQGLVEMIIPNGYFVAGRTWSERWITFDNYQQDAVTTVRLAVMTMRSGNIAIVSNRGDYFGLLAESKVKLPTGRKVQLVLRAYLSANGEADTVALLDGSVVCISHAPNIDAATVIGRARLGVDGARGAVSQNGTFYRMVTRYDGGLR